MTTVTIEPESQLAKAIRQAARSGEVLIVRTGDWSYTLSIGEELAPDDSRRPKPEEVQAVRDALATVAEGWTGVDIDEFKTYTRERRKTGSRPPAER